MKALRLPTPHPARFWFATGFRAVLRGSCSPKRSRADGGAARAWAVWSAGGPIPADARVDGVGSHRFPGHPSRAFALLQDPGRISGPSPTRSHRCCPRAQHGEGFSGHMISRLPQSFGTRCLRFARNVAAARARLASGWLVGLCRERVELSGSRRKVSERSHVILLSRAYPVASWAHARRKFFEIAELKKAPIAIEAVRRIDALFAIESEIRGRSADERRAVRQARSRPLVEAFEPWLREKLALVSQKSRLAEAIRYALSRWTGLCLFLADGRVEIDSNVVERSMRPLALTRKNALFAGSDGGAAHWAVIASLIETCKLIGVEPQAYLADVINRIVNGHPQSRLDELLPWAYPTHPPSRRPLKKQNTAYILSIALQ